MIKSLRVLTASVMCAAVVSAASAGPTMAAMMEIDITYYSDASFTTIVGEYFKSCDGKVYKWGKFSDFYEYVGTPCD